MAQTLVAPIVPVDGSNAVLTSSTELNLVEVAADSVNGNSFLSTGNEVLVLHNTDTVQHTVTISSVPDSLGRTNDITNYPIPAGTIASVSFLGAFGTVGWKQPDGTVHFAASDPTIKVTVLQINL